MSKAQAFDSKLTFTSSASRWLSSTNKDARLRELLRPVPSVRKSIKAASRVGGGPATQPAVGGTTAAATTATTTATAAGTRRESTAFASTAASASTSAFLGRSTRGLDADGEPAPDGPVDVPESAAVVAHRMEKLRRKTREDISQELLANGWVESYIDFFRLTHRGPVVIDDLSNETFDWPTEQFEFLRDALCQAEDSLRKFPFDVPMFYQAMDTLSQFCESVRDWKETIYWREETLRRLYRRLVQPRDVPVLISSLVSPRTWFWATDPVPGMGNLGTTEADMSSFLGNRNAASSGALLQNPSSMSSTNLSGFGNRTAFGLDIPPVGSDIPMLDMWNLDSCMQSVQQNEANLLYATAFLFRAGVRKWIALALGDCARLYTRLDRWSDAMVLYEQQLGWLTAESTVDPADDPSILQSSTSNVDDVISDAQLVDARFHLMEAYLSVAAEILGPKFAPNRVDQVLGNDDMSAADGSDMLSSDSRSTTRTTTAASTAMSIQKSLRNLGRPASSAFSDSNDLSATEQILSEVEQSIFEEAISYYRKALEQANALDAVERKGDILSYLAVCFQKMGEHEQALLLYVEFRNLAKQTNQPRREGEACSRLAQVYLSLSDIENAITSLERFFELGQMVADERALARAAFQLGSLYSKLDAHHKAVEYFTRSFELAFKLNDRKSMELARIQLGLARGKAGFRDYMSIVCEDNASNVLQYQVARQNRSASARPPRRKASTPAAGGGADGAAPGGGDGSSSLDQGIRDSQSEDDSGEGGEADEFSGDEEDEENLSGDDDDDDDDEDEDAEGDDDSVVEGSDNDRDDDGEFRS